MGFLPCLQGTLGTVLSMHAPKLLPVGWPCGLVTDKLNFREENLRCAFLQVCESVWVQQVGEASNMLSASVAHGVINVASLRRLRNLGFCFRVPQPRYSDRLPSPDKMIAEITCFHISYDAQP